MSPAEALRQAVTLHQAGRLQEAEQWYRALLQAAPDHADANHNLGLLLRSSQSLEAGLPYLQRAANIDPAHPQFAVSYSSALLDAGRAGDAANMLDRAFSGGLDTPALNCNRGNAARALGDQDSAEARFRRALALDPQYALAWYNLGGLLQERGRLNEAVDAYRAAVQAAPDFAEAGNNLALVLQIQERNDEAISVLVEVLRRQPDYADGYRSLGALLEAERRDEPAWQCYARAIELAPGVADTHYHAGLVLLRLDKPHDATTQFALAIAIDDKHARAYNELGNVQRQLGARADAAQSYTAATAIQPDFAEAFSNLGNALLELGRLGEAEIACRRAVELAPALPEAHFNLGNIHRAAHQAEAAAAAYREAVALRPGYAAAWCNLGLTVQAFDHAEAEACCHQALQADPELPQALVFLADIVSDQGKFSEAEALLRRAIANVPDMAAAWAGLALLRKMTQADRPWLEKAEQIAAGNLTAEEAAHLQFAIGKFLDDLKDYEQAFVHYQRANDLSKLLTPAYVAASEEKIADDLCARYTSQFFNVRNKTPDSRLPVFVLGMPRSGTSLAEQIIAAHPQAFGAGELPFWQFAASELDVAPPPNFEERLQKLSADYLTRLQKMAPQASRVVDKMPGNFRQIGLIHAAFPEARFIHMRRNPVDTCLSIYFQHFGSAHTYANDLNNLAHYYLQYRRLMAHWQSAIGSEFILDLRYEDLVGDQEASTRRLLDFIGLPWNDACLDFNAVGNTVGTASKWQVRQKIHQASVERWRHYESHLTPLLELR